MNARNNENRTHILEIAKTLDQIAAGELFLSAGEYYTEAEMNDAIRAGDLDGDEFEQATMYEYFENALDFTYYSSGRNGEYRGVRIMVTCGGPNIFVDTYRRTVELHWWSESETVELFYDAAAAIDEAFAELYEAW